jgi:hypothetical protein
VADGGGMEVGVLVLHHVVGMRCSSSHTVRSSAIVSRWRWTEKYEHRTTSLILFDIFGRKTILMEPSDFSPWSKLELLFFNECCMTLG